MAATQKTGKQTSPCRVGCATEVMPITKAEPQETVSAAIFYPGLTMPVKATDSSSPLF